MMKASIRLLTDGDAGMLAKALLPETREEIPGSAMSVSADGEDLTIVIEAEDAVALRAALNSYFRWTKLAMDAEETLGVLP